MDIENESDLLIYLQLKGLCKPGERVRTKILRGGVSNRTVLVERDQGDAWVLKQALEKLRVEADWFSSPERIHREAAGIRWLTRLTPPGSVAPLVFEDLEAHIIVMEAVPAAPETWKALLLRGDVSPEHVKQFATLLATIHREAAGRSDVKAEFNDRSFFVSLRVEPYYLHAATRVPEAAGFIRTLVQDTEKRQLTLVHGDYSPKNILVCCDRSVLLDHEVIHYGDPAFDLGFALAHLLSKAHHLPAHRSALEGAAHEFWEIYRQTLGGATFARDLGSYAVQHTLACLLARVVGRSPLEYLDQIERSRQLDAASALLSQSPATVELLIPAFLEELDRVRD